MIADYIDHFAVRICIYVVVLMSEAFGLRGSGCVVLLLIHLQESLVSSSTLPLEWMRVLHARDDVGFLLCAWLYSSSSVVLLPRIGLLRGFFS